MCQLVNPGLCSFRSWSTVTITKEALPDSLPKPLLLCLPAQCTMSSKEAVADLRCSTITTDMVCSDILDNMVYMYTVNNRTRVLIYV